MVVGDLNFCAELQKKLREMAQKHIDAMLLEKVGEYTIGGIEGYVLILGQKHSIHNGKILKAPHQVINHD